MTTAKRRGAAFLAERVGRAASRMGRFFPGSHVIFRGKDLHRDLGHVDWVELFVFGITGRRYSAPQVRLLHALWTTTSYPDLRIWNNRVAALAGSARSTGNLALSGALAVSEATIYGRGIDIRAIDFLLRAEAHRASGGELSELLRNTLQRQRSIAGYGRPLVARDERIGHVLSLARELGLADGPHVKLAFVLEELLLRGKWRQRLNYGGVAAALAADLGFTPREYYLFMFPAFLAGMPPCFMEAEQAPEGGLFPLPCGGVRYEGEPDRAWKIAR